MKLLTSTPTLWPVALAIALALSLSVVPASAEETLPEAAEILDAYVEATGGKPAYDKLRNRVTRGTFEIVGQGISGALTIYHARPNRIYTSIESETIGTIERGVEDGVVWENSMMAGPSIKTGGEREDALRDARFDRLDNWRESYAAVRTIGRDSIDDRACVKVELSVESGTPQIFCFDHESHLLVKVEATIRTQMGDLPIQSFPTDYREVDGIRLPHETRVIVMGSERKLTIDSITHNSDLPQDRFALPPDIAALLERAD